VRAVLLLAVTGAPGLSRLLLFLLVQGLLGLDALGRFASDVAVTQLAGFFSGVGVSALVMIRVPQAEAGDRLGVALGLAWPSLAWLAAGSAAIFVLHAAGWVYAWGLSAAVLAGFSLLMLVRRYMLALKAYALLLAVELGVLAVMLGGVAVFREAGAPAAYASLAGSQLLAGLGCGGWALVRHLKRGGGPPRPGAGAFRRSFEFGAGNLCSGGRTQLLVPLTAQLCGASWSGLVGLMQSLLGLVLLFPRGLSQFHIPDLAALSSRRRIESLRGVLHRFQSQVNRLLLALVVGVGAGWLAAGDWLLEPGMRGPAQLALFGLLLAAVAVDQQVIPKASLLISLEHSRRLAVLNAMALGVMLPLAAGALLLDGPVARVYWLAGSYLASTVIRTLRLRVLASRRLAGLEREAGA
jgi:hypothetical protein